MNPEKLNNLISETFGTRNEFAAKMKVSRWTAYRWLDNPERMDLKALKRLAKLTGKPLTELV
jgi:hypothetical protein